MAGGNAAISIMQDYFPILVDTREVKTFDVGLPQDIIFIDKQGIKHEPELVNAVLNGIEIDVNTFEDSSRENENKDEKTIDI